MMEYDENKVDEYTLALLYLVTHEIHEGFGARAWKGFDWDTMNRLHEKGFISNPISGGRPLEYWLTTDSDYSIEILCHAKLA